MTLLEPWIYKEGVSASVGEGQRGTPRCACDWLGCEKRATTIAAKSETGPVGHYCIWHAHLAAEGGKYKARCPQCGCRFGVGR